MTLIDTSAWVEFLRGTGSATHKQLAALIAADAALATTEVVIMEVLAGARDDAHLQRLRRLLARCDVLATAGLEDYERAAEVYRSCRRTGATIRNLCDCLIAAVALRTNTPVLFLDSDFDAIARRQPLRVAGPASKT